MPSLISLVVPHAGTWIEIEYKGLDTKVVWVVPHAGTWIEISGCHGIE